MVFLQMARDLDLSDLILLGYELCGWHALRPDCEQGFVTRSVRLTNTASLGKFVCEATGAPGVKVARRALRSVIDGSRSPMESAAAMLWSLPVMIGGRNCPTPLLNHRIPLEGAARKLAGRSFVECDLSWPTCGIAVEYDSNAHHMSPHELSRDASKRAALDSMGITVFSLTADQIMDVGRMDALLRLIAKKAGWRLGPQGPRELARQADLRRRLLPHRGG